MLEEAFKVIVEKEACGMGDIVMPVLVKYELIDAANSIIKNDVEKSYQLVMCTIA